MSELALQRIYEEKKNRTGRLDLGNTGMTEWPKELFKYTWLEELNLSSEYFDQEKNKWVEPRSDGPENIISSIPEEINHLKYLKVFTCCGNIINHLKIKTIPELSGLKELILLNLWCNQINEICGLDKLGSLQQLDLSFNQISEISGLDKLGSLQQLNLRRNQINEISGLDTLGSLQHLDLGSNQINEISDLDKLVSLQHLNLGGNQISEISGLDNFKNVHILMLFDNPIQNIPKALLGKERFDENCKPNLISWFRDLEQGKEINLTIKLFLNGNGSTGKTSLVEALKNGTCENDPESTHGILVSFLDLPDENNKIRFMIWDFGGQEIYHSTHRLFLSSEAVHLVVSDTETEKLAEEQTTVGDRITAKPMRHLPLAFWLHTVNELCPESAVILVRNKADLHKEIHPAIKNSIGECNDAELHVSATEGTNIESLALKIKNQGKTLNDYGFEMPASWIRARDFCLHNLETERHKITTKEAFKRFCVRCCNVMPLSFDAQLTFLHHTGALYKNDQHLGETLILDQRWALNAIYKPFQRGHWFYQLMSENTKGVARIHSLFHSFGDSYNENEKWLFVELMMSCQVCFKVNDGENLSKDSQLVFPVFLPGKTPKSVIDIWEGKNKNASIFRRNYSYLDYYKVQSILIRLGHKTSLDYMWKYGILIKTDEGWFKIEVNTKEKTIDLIIEKPAVKKWLRTIIQIVDGKYYGQKLEKLEEWSFSEDGAQFYELKYDRFFKEIYPDTQSEPTDVEKKPEEKLPDVLQKVLELDRKVSRIHEDIIDLFSFIEQKHHETIKILTKELDEFSNGLLKEMYQSLENNELKNEEIETLLNHVLSVIEKGQVEVEPQALEKLNDPNIRLKVKIKIALPIQLSWLQFEVGGEIDWEDSLPKAWDKFKGKLNQIANKQYDRARSNWPGRY